MSVFDRPAAWLLPRIDKWRSIAVYPLLWTYRLTDQRAVIDADCQRWADLLWLGPHERSRLLGRFLYAFPEFRSVYYHRLASGNPAGVLAGRLVNHVWKGVGGVDFSGTPIGPGLFLSHGQGTILSAERIGANLQVHQGVTVGWDYRGDRRPIIGDDVFIGAGAKVLGAITVGDGARIGANAVVVSDVPAGATAVGIPARIKSPLSC
ncbi:MAG TPA: DapH/DapD/GlmU-related protein [Acidimicrobiales bacterium]|jgi:serine O-acetyltransferase|nr:DapH/DapD/GlmU-related protein [Acidimicrobiales bacterium]